MFLSSEKPQKLDASGTRCATGVPLPDGWVARLHRAARRHAVCSGAWNAPLPDLPFRAGFPLLAIISPEGLFSGERLAACSDAAQLHWVRLFTASNTFARIELSYRNILAVAYQSIRNKPTEEELGAWIGEYVDNFLLFVYQAPDGSTWGQWLTSAEYLSKYQTAADRRSPAPDSKELEKFRRTYVEKKQRKSLRIIGHSKPHQTMSNHSLGIGIGIGIGNGIGEELGLSPLSPPAPSEPKIRPEDFANAWNQRRGNLPKVDKFTESRRRKVKTRMAEGLSLDRFIEAVENCRVKPFLHGDNDRGWTATFDWLMNNSENVEKAVNNPYGLNRKNGGNHVNRSQAVVDSIHRVLGHDQDESSREVDGGAVCGPQSRPHERDAGDLFPHTIDGVKA